MPVGDGIEYLSALMLNDSAEDPGLYKMGKVQWAVGSIQLPPSWLGSDWLFRVMVAITSQWTVSLTFPLKLPLSGILITVPGEETKDMTPLFLGRRWSLRTELLVCHDSFSVSVLIPLLRIFFSALVILAWLCGFLGGGECEWMFTWSF